MSAKQIEFMPVYEAADLWIERALKRDDSLFTPGTPIWSRDCIAKARTRFLDKIEAWNGGDFFGKLETVLKGSPPEVYQLVGEAVYVTYLMVWNGAVGQEKKIANINWATGKRVGIPHSLRAAQKTGIMTPGAFFIAKFGVHPAFVIEFVDKWKKECSRDELLDRADPKAPWKFKKFVMEMGLRVVTKGIAFGAPNFMRVALLHMAHPDTFEAMVIPNKQKLAKAPAFQHFITAPTNDDDDCKIQQIRKGLEPRYGENFTFFDSGILPLWRDNQNNGNNQ